MSRMRFGIFMAPFHPAGVNPTVLLDSDIELVEHLDKLGYDEAWIGEHHSAGSETIAWFDYFQHTAAFPQMAVGDGTTVKECIDFVNDSGLGTIGTPDDAVEQIDRLVKQSNGGFGAFLQLAHDWAAPAAKFRSYELFARHVAPHFQGQFHSTIESKARARAARPQLAENNMKAVEAVTAKYEAEKAASASASAGGGGV